MVCDVVWRVTFGVSLLCSCVLFKMCVCFVCGLLCADVYALLLLSLFVCFLIKVSVVVFDGACVCV